MPSTPIPKIASQCQIGGAAIDAPVQCRDRRHAELFEAVDGALESVAVVVIVLTGVAFHQRADVKTRTEAFASVRQHKNPDRDVGIDAVEELFEHVQIRRLDAIVLARAIKPDHGATFGDSQDRRAWFIKNG
jgi:hypothetical protein